MVSCRILWHASVELDSTMHVAERIPTAKGRAVDGNLLLDNERNSEMSVSFKKKIKLQTRRVSELREWYGTPHAANMRKYWNFNTYTIG